MQENATFSRVAETGLPGPHAVAGYRLGAGPTTGPAAHRGVEGQGGRCRSRTTGSDRRTGPGTCRRAESRAAAVRGALKKAEREQTTSFWGEAARSTRRRSLAVAHWGAGGAAPLNGDGRAQPRTQGWFAGVRPGRPAHLEGVAPGLPRGRSASRVVHPRLELRHARLPPVRVSSGPPAAVPPPRRRRHGRGRGTCGGRRSRGGTRGRCARPG